MNTLLRVGPAVALLAALCSCGGAGGGQADDRTLVISAWDAGGGSDPLDVAARDFERENPGVRVIVKKAAYSQFMQSLRRQLNAGQVPDVIRTLLGYSEAGSVRALVDKKLLADLGSAPWARSIPESARAAVGEAGMTYAYPTDLSAIGILYVPAELAKRGLDVPRTFPELLALCRKNAASGGVTFALGAEQDSGMPRFVAFGLAASSVYARTPDFDQQRMDGKTTFAGSAGWRDALTRFVAMRDARCFDKDSAGISQEAASSSLGQGKTLMAVALTPTLPLFQAGNPQATFAMAPFPGTDRAEDVRVPVYPTSGLAIPLKAPHQALARKFVDFYAANRSSYSKIDSSVPVIADKSGDPLLPSYARGLEESLRGGATAPIADNQWPNPEVGARFGAGLVQILLNRGTPADVLASMDSVWTAEAP